MRFLTFKKKWLGGSEAQQESLGGVRGPARGIRGPARGVKGPVRGDQRVAGGVRGVARAVRRPARGVRAVRRPARRVREERRPARGLERFISYDFTVNFYFNKKKPKKSLFWGVLRLLTVGAHPRPFQTDMKDEFHSSTRSNAL